MPPRTTLRLPRNATRAPILIWLAAHLTQAARAFLDLVKVGR